MHSKDISEYREGVDNLERMHRKDLAKLEAANKRMEEGKLEERAHYHEVIDNWRTYMKRQNGIHVDY